MVYSGVKSKILSSVRIDEECVICHQSGTVSLIVEQSYTHVFFLPFFPLKKKVFTHCEFCKYVHLESEMPVQYLNYIEQVKPYTRTPLWMWSGLLVCGLLIVVGSYLGQKNDEKNLILIDDPVVGQVYEWRTSDGDYTISKVSKVNGDSVFMQFSQLSSNKISGLRNLEKAGDHIFRKDVSGFSKRDLKKMLETGEIIDINK